MADIAKTFAELLAKHDLTLLSIGINAKPLSPEFLWSASAHWEGFSINDIPCAMGEGPTPMAAIQDTLARMQAKRAAPIDTPTTLEIAA